MDLSRHRRASVDGFIGNLESTIAPADAGAPARTRKTVSLTLSVTEDFGAALLAPPLQEQGGDNQDKGEGEGEVRKTAKKSAIERIRQKCDKLESLLHWGRSKPDMEKEKEKDRKQKDAPRQPPRPATPLVQVAARNSQPVGRTFAALNAVNAVNGLRGSTGRADSASKATARAGTATANAQVRASYGRNQLAQTNYGVGGLALGLQLSPGWDVVALEMEVLGLRRELQARRAEELRLRREIHKLRCAMDLSRHRRASVDGFIGNLESTIAPADAGAPARTRKTVSLTLSVTEDFGAALLAPPLQEQGGDNQDKGEGEGEVRKTAKKSAIERIRQKCDKLESLLHWGRSKPDMEKEKEKDRKQKDAPRQPPRPATPSGATLSAVFLAEQPFQQRRQ
ncbi:uncharacterized protein LOC117648417 [Thrips palmi]|uniref:Uncharacterized protein LOC117648417 n=1 Tax=Thrips palmi TaxID=161013 RepID=A0A6P8Z2V1_THRPL|nr:uncharacterized protein LOC117648417 [Thrips palmi]